MIRSIVTVDEETCNSCGLCADACHEGAIGIVDGNAKLLREDDFSRIGIPVDFSGTKNILTLLR